MKKSPVIYSLCLSIIAAFFGLPAQGEEGGIESLRQTGKAFAAVSREVSPSVVAVQTERGMAGSAPGQSPFGEQWPFGNELFERFFGDLLPGQPRGQTPPPQRYVFNQGSGFIYRLDQDKTPTTAYVLTNSHVVENADKIRLTFEDGQSYEAQVVGTDPPSDVAVLKFDNANVRALPLADSAKLQVGEWVLALGNPFGLQHTLTVGVVSATGRTSLGISDYEDFIQTDAAINPGNSGGPLVNLNGEVVGINTAIFSRSGGYMGIGFAIPINLAKQVADQLIEQGSVVRGHLGVVIQELTPELARSFDLERTQGILVAQVMENSPAAAAGLQPGDIILSYAGKTMTDSGDFRNRVALTAPGSQKKLEIVRAGRQQTLTVEIGRLPQEQMAVLRTPHSVQELGLSVAESTPPLREQFGIESDQGVVVTEVESGSVAAQAGIDVGTVILEVDRKPVRNAEEFTEAVAASKADKEVLLLVRQVDMQQFVVLQW